ncbi:type II secretion system protein GspG [bacterium]|nr:type II secretion system protein GspG [bacterium]
MNGWTLNEAARVAAQNPFVARLVLVSLELVVFAAIVAMLIRALRLSTPRLCALLWLVVLAKPILGLVIGTPVPLLRFDAAPAMTAAVEHEAAVNQALNEIAKSDVALKPGAIVSSQAPAAIQASSTIAAPAPAVHKTSEHTVWSAISPIRALEYAWLAVVLGLTAYLLIDMRRLKSLVGRAGAPSPELQRVFDEVARDLGLTKLPNLRISDALDSPALAGIIHPVVLLPAWIAEQARPEQFAWLLRHELMHFKMRDPLGLAVRRVSEVLFFFHPAVWWAGRKWEESMELACDRALLSTNDDARSYAEQLYWVLEHRLNRQRMLRAGLCATRTQIGKRIASLLSNPIRLSSRLNTAALSGLAIVALVGLTMGFGFREPAHAQAPTPVRKPTNTSNANPVGSKPMILAKDGKTYDELAGLSQDLKDKILRQRSDISWVAAAIAVYVQRHHALPDSLSQLPGPETKLDRVPNDLFAVERPLSYMLSRDRQEATIYSVGPDGKDDSGSIQMKGPFSKEATPQGDIVQVVRLHDLWSPEREQSRLNDTKKLRDELVAIREKTGRDNAMLYYIEASVQMGRVPLVGMGDEIDLIQATLANGWTEKSTPLLTTLARFETSMAQVRKAVALDHAENFVGDFGPDTPVPNFLAAQTLGKMLCVEGCWLESQGKYTQALDDYLAALTMGRDYGAPKATLIGGLISVYIERMALDQITRLVASGKLDRGDLERLAVRLKKVESTQGQFIDALAGEFNCAQWVFDKARKDPDAFRVEFNKWYAEGKAPIKADDFIKNVDKIEADHKSLVDWEVARIHTPYWEREAKGYTEAAFKSMLEQSHPFLSHSWPNFREADVRYLTTVARMAMARVATALELYRIDNGAYPDDLKQLVPACIESVPVDPFSGKPLLYSLSADKKTYQLWSVGPDSTDNKTVISYDPTNGTVSGGDIASVH